MSYSSTDSWGSDSIPDAQPLPGERSNPVFAERELAANVTIKYSTERARESLKEACVGAESWLDSLEALLPEFYSNAERKQLHEAICASLLAVLATATGTGSLLVLPSFGAAVASILLRFLYNQLVRYMDDSHQAATLLYTEICEASKKKFLVKPEHNYLQFDVLSGTMTLSKILHNRSPRDRENCVDNVLQTEFRLGSRRFATRDESKISSKFNIFTFHDALTFFGSKHVMLSWDLGGIASIPLWYAKGRVSEHRRFIKTVIAKFGVAPPEIDISTLQLCRFLKVIRINGVDICVVLFCDDQIPGLKVGKVYITKDFIVKASIALLPSAMMETPVVPLSIRQSYKKTTSSNNITIQARPTLFRRNDGLVADAETNIIVRPWKGTVVVDTLANDLDALDL